MKLRNLKEFLKRYDIILYDEQYRILNSLLIKKKNQIGGGKNIYKSELGTGKYIIEYNINKMLKY